MCDTIATAVTITMMMTLGKRWETPGDDGFEDDDDNSDDDGFVTVMVVLVMISICSYNTDKRYPPQKKKEVIKPYHSVSGQRCGSFAFVFLQTSLKK